MVAAMTNVFLLNMYVTLLKYILMSAKKTYETSKQKINRPAEQPPQALSHPCGKIQEPPGQLTKSSYSPLPDSSRYLPL